MRLGALQSGASRTNKNLSYKMPGIARSIAKKKQMARAEQEKAYAEAMKEYRDEQKKPESERKSRKAICRDVAEKWKAMRKPVTDGPVVSSTQNKMHGFHLRRKRALLHTVSSLETEDSLSITLDSSFTSTHSYELAFSPTSQKLGWERTGPNDSFCGIPHVSVSTGANLWILLVDGPLIHLPTKWEGRAAAMAKRGTSSHIQRRSEAVGGGERLCQAREASTKVDQTKTGQIRVAAT
ncbi:hypothetical protein F4604DRAFT_1751735 [Suillus subluteus]|nr:hypothetical protein F4604DRAFT_1751735 [Suillus subluteus]